jgi:hypothetical protein
MASILFLNKMAANYLVKARTNESVLIGSVSKFCIESYLLSNEFAIYSVFFTVGALESAVMAGGALCCYGVHVLAPMIAGFRTYDSITAKDIHVLQLQ